MKKVVGNVWKEFRNDTEEDNMTAFLNDIEAETYDASLFIK